MNIKHFSIRNLHGCWDFEIPIVDNTLVIVGENGSGKTTIVNIMYYFLSGQWSRLRDYEFDTITAIIEDSEIELSKQLIENLRSGAKYGLPISLRRKLDSIQRRMELGGIPLDTHVIARHCHNFGIPVDIALDYLGYGEGGSSRNKALIKRRKKELKNLIKAQILYLPTYRRIEQELKFIFPNLDIDEIGDRGRRVDRTSETSEYIELIEFGMNDVVEKIDRSMNVLKDFVRQGLNDLTLRYLSEVIDADYENVDLKSIMTADKSTINAVLDRIDPALLPKAEKRRLEIIIGQIRSGQEATAHIKVIAHFFLQLLYLQHEQHMRESHVRSFLEICNSYLLPTKELVYDNKEFQIAIRLTAYKKKKKKYRGIDLKFKHLSSGEKQIVSLFSHLFLSERRGFFVIIDEPELSLSVPWQQKLLVDIKSSGLCTGLVAVTHSPFIYENELDTYAHSLNEYRE